MKSTAKPSLGSCRELEVAEFLRLRNWSILYHDVKIIHVQVDLLVRDPHGHLALIEVKSYSACAHLSRAQAQRLSRVACFLSQFEPVDIFLAFVHWRSVEILPVDGLTDF